MIVRIEKQEEIMRLNAFRSTSIAISIILTVLVTSVQAQQAAAPVQPQHQGGQSLDQAANDPTASLMSVQIQNLYSGSHHNLEHEDSNTILLRPAVPFKTGDLNHIARATVPIVTGSPSGKTGLGDAVLFDLIVFNQSKGRWGVGPVMLLPTATNNALGAEKWALGPALGFVVQETGFIWGLFNQNLFSFAGNGNRDDVRLSILQPIVNVSLPDKWSVGTSEMNVTYDWEKGGWANLPLGLKVNKLHRFSSMPVQFSGSYEYNFADRYVAPEWSVNFAVKFLFPI
jgi:hypothetical protein